jgi:hypothetical protein
MSRPVLTRDDKIAPAPLDDEESVAIRFGESALLGAAAAILGSLPAAVRAGSPEVPVWQAWIAAAAMTAIPFAVLVALGRAARRAWRKLVGGSGEPVGVGVIAWVAIALPLYVVLGTVLKAATHNRALGGMTFAILALGLAVIAALVAWRTVGFAMDLLARRSTRTVAVGSVALLLFALALVTPVGRAIVATGLGLSALPLGVRAAFVDGAMALVAIPLAVAVDPGPSIRRPLALAGAPVLVALALAGGAMIASSPELGRALGTRTALAGPMAATLGLVHGAELEPSGPTAAPESPER